ncbi:MAG: cobyrinate a,c-diamide synthase [Deltaproteobacteria bacterium]|nr:cobyrinate a,c-diamide synthase [Deltaproteobacteria bacterium]
MDPLLEKRVKIARLCIAGTHSGCGKTTVSLGIMAALVMRGYTVQPFKVGPDFIDPGHHRRVTGRDSHNLDGWILDPEHNRQIFERYGHDAHVSVVEGVMGLFDGFSGSDEAGSTAQMAKWLDLPVILIIDARAMARSAAAVALGFSRFDPDLSLKGIIFNRVGSKGHAQVIEDALRSSTELPLFGCLPYNEELEIPSRHLGLVTHEDFGMGENLIRQLAHWIEENVDLVRLMECLDLPDRPAVQAIEMARDTQRHTEAKTRIGIAMDEAFCFYYLENLRLLREAGAALEFFSPLHSKHLPKGIKGLILGGGYPELHCKALSQNHDLLNEIRMFALSGRPVYAECGGLMFLMKEIRDLKGHSYPMAGIFNMTAQMERRLNALGYREVITRKESMLGPSGTRVKGHEFHYSLISNIGSPVECIYSMNDRNLRLNKDEGFFKNRVLGSYVHLHWGSNPEVATCFVDYCRRFDG